MYSHLIKPGLVATLMVLSLALAVGLRPSQKMADIRPQMPLADVIPSQFQDWRIDDSMPVILPTADVQARLDKIYNQIVARTYINKLGYRVMISVAYGGDQSDALSVHRPELCYPAQGFEVSDLRHGQLVVGASTLPVTRLLTKRGSRREPVTYWLVNGDVAVSERFEARIAQFRYGFRGIVPDGMLVRISSIDADSTEAFKLQDEFSRQLLASLVASARRRFGIS